MRRHRCCLRFERFETVQGSHYSEDAVTSPVRLLDEDWKRLLQAGLRAEPAECLRGGDTDLRGGIVERRMQLR